jgi:DNA-binding NarL/FixJ family response regulator
MTEGAWNDDAIRVLVVDDHDLFRAGLASLLNAQPGIEVVAQASGGRMGVRLAEELQPDVVLMDYRMPGLNGAEATRAVLASYPSARVVCYSASVTTEEIDEVMRAGAVACVTKDENFDRLVSTIQEAAAA